VLPALNALLTDRDFASDLKSKLGVKDEQLIALRRVTRDGIAELSRTGHSSKAGAAGIGESVERRIGSVIGAEKSNQLLTLATYGAGTGVKPSFSCSPPADTRVVVNIPAFRMDVFETGKLIKSFMIGIGYPEHPLPVGIREANTILFNPSWTPPDEDWVEAAGFKVEVGETIEPGDRRNPLGLVKVPIGLPSLIHGGKRPSQIGGFASHGCVGLTNTQAIDFVKLLARIGGVDLSDGQIASYIRSRRKTESIELKVPVPVELRYDTIVPENGRLRIYRDVYSRYSNTEQSLRAALASCGLTVDQLSEHERASIRTALKEMSRDPQGRFLSGEGEHEATPPAPAKRGERVTRAVKGAKEMTVELAILEGKGYPIASEVVTGKVSPRQNTRRKR
jgi:hypothetical protein